MTLTYLGESKKGKGDRFGILEYPNNEEEKAEKIIEKIIDAGYKAHGFGDDTDTTYWIEVYDRDDFDELMDIYQAAKKELGE